MAKNKLLVKKTKDLIYATADGVKKECDELGGENLKKLKSESLKCLKKEREKLAEEEVEKLLEKVEEKIEQYRLKKQDLLDLIYATADDVRKECDAVWSEKTKKLKSESLDRLEKAKEEVENGTDPENDDGKK